MTGGEQVHRVCNCGRRWVEQCSERRAEFNDSAEDNGARTRPRAVSKSAASRIPHAVSAVSASMRGDSPSQLIYPACFANTCWSTFSFSPANTSNHGNLATLGRDLQRSYQAWSLG